MTTTAVIAELQAGVAQFPELEDALVLPWLRVEALEEIDQLELFGLYAQRFGSDDHDVGEATVLAWAEAKQATALTDDETAVRVGRDRGVRVVRTLALVARGVRVGLLSASSAEDLVDALLQGGARFPFRAGEFISWAREHHLLGNPGATP